jgi:acetolactate synthase-1/2/3 large subunit
MHGEIVTTTAAFAPAFERAWNATTSALLELRVDPEAVSPRASLSAIRAEAVANQSNRQDAKSSK